MAEELADELIGVYLARLPKESFSNILYLAVSLGLKAPQLLEQHIEYANKKAKLFQLDALAAHKMQEAACSRGDAKRAKLESCVIAHAEKCAQAELQFADKLAKAYHLSRMIQWVGQNRFNFILQNLNQYTLH